MKSLEEQQGGNHYLGLKIQPMEYAMANNLSPAEYNVVKYVSRWRKKGGVGDIKKAMHSLQMLLEQAELLEEAAEDAAAKPGGGLESFKVRGPINAPLKPLIPLAAECQAYPRAPTRAWHDSTGACGPLYGVRKTTPPTDDPTNPGET